jgi:uncharacterized membrane protein YdjX (TVP38/TMEM64 family)
MQAALMTVAHPSRGDRPASARRFRSIRRFVPLAVLAAGAIAFVALGLHRQLSFATLAAHREVLLELVGRHAALAAAGYVLVYALATALSIPGAALLSLTGGFLFGTIAGTILAVIAASLGATAVFLAARTALGGLLRGRAGSWLQRLETGFREDALSYLLLLRLVPLFPFAAVNLVAAFLGVPLKTYVIATVLGIIPGALVYASVGSGLGAVFDAGATPNLGIALEPRILLPILGLSVLALVPVVYKRIAARRR